MKLEYLKQFITLANLGTLTKASEKLHISQSTLSRNMQALERKLDVKLFFRTANRIEITETGHYSIPKFQELLDLHQDMLSSIKSFDDHEAVIKVGVCAQGPKWKICKLQDALDSLTKLEIHMTDEAELLRALKDGQLDLIITSFPIQMQGTKSHFYFQEQLYLSVPKSHELYDRTEITFGELDGQTLLVRTEIGIWQEVIDSLSHVNFIVQDRNTFDKLIGRFSLPAFTTNISQQYTLGDERHNIIITDELARKDYYISYMSNNYERLSCIINLCI